MRRRAALQEKEEALHDELIINLKTGDRIEGRLTRTFRNNDIDIELLVAGAKEKLLFIAIHELMVATAGIKSAIRQEKGLDELRSIALAEGMWSLKMDGLMKVLQGETDIEHILRVCM